MKRTGLILEKINREELYRYIGTPDDCVRGIVSKAEDELISQVKPAYVWQMFDIEQGDYGVKLVGTDLALKGESIKAHLDSCEKAVILAATLSGEADRLIRKYQINDMVTAVIMDALSSVAIEQICNRAEEDIKSYIDGCFLTYRYGVGYGDFPIEQEKEILDMVNSSKNIGLCVTEDNILTPLKSVVCVIGISRKKLDKGQKGCTTCNMRDTCKYRRQGLNCAN